MPYNRQILLIRIYFLKIFFFRCDMLMQMGNCCACCVSGILLHDEHNCDCDAAARRLRSCQCTHWCEYLRRELSDPSRCYCLHASWRVKGNLLGELHTLSHRYAIWSFLFLWIGTISRWEWVWYGLTKNLIYSLPSFGWILALRYSLVIVIKTVALSFWSWISPVIKCYRGNRRSMLAWPCKTFLSMRYRNLHWPIYLFSNREMGESNMNMQK